MNSLQDVLQTRNVFKNVLPNYDKQYAVRPGQIYMAENIAMSLENEDYIFIEAKTGVGKSNGYLVPMILYASKNSTARVVISTGTKVLQDELYHKHLPKLLKAMNKNISYAILKGKNNYLCPYKYENARAKGRLNEIIYNRCRSSQEVEELRLDHEQEHLASVVNADDTCVGRNCAYFHKCPLYAARRKAREARIIITNHHVVAQHIRFPTSGLLPPYDKIVFDEAHNLPAIISQVFTRSLSERSIQNLIEEALAIFDFDDDTCDWLIQLHHAAYNLFRSIQPESSKFSGQSFLVNRSLFDYNSADQIVSLCNKLTTANSDSTERLVNLFKKYSVHTTQEDLAKVYQISDRLFSLGQDIQFISKMHKHFAAWAEIKTVKRTEETYVVLHYTPIDIGPLFQKRFLPCGKGGVMTSATLGVGGKITHFKKMLGYKDDAAKDFIEIGSPFDYDKNCCVYVPDDLPAHNDPNFIAKSAERITQIVETMKGRTLVLCTSIKSMRTLYEIVKAHTQYLCMMQGELPSAKLLKQFKENPHSVLFATKSMWEGVDIPGDSLSCVIMDKLPFPNQSDPLVQAAVRYFDEQHLNSFKMYQIPEAVILFQQGFGRLIRTENDKGLVVILDNRVLDAHYSDYFVRAIPTKNIVRNFDETINWLKSAEVI